MTDEHLTSTDPPAGGKTPTTLGKTRPSRWRPRPRRRGPEPNDGSQSAPRSSRPCRGGRTAPCATSR
ncbi:hypothetical protein NKG05_23820 [Oerskovia sp. M15]